MLFAVDEATLLHAFAEMFTLRGMTLMMFGTAAGIVVGAIPGLTGAMLIALTLPLTFTMERPEDAMILLVSMYVGSVSGGLISATLLRMPGTPSSMMTTLDGYPMAQKGQPGRALGLGIGASLLGGIISWFFLWILSEPIARLATRMSPFDLFSLVVVALVLIGSVSGKSLLRGVFAGLLGILAALPGTSPATGELRWTLGMPEMNDGLKLLPVLVGMFAINQVISDMIKLDESPPQAKWSYGGLFSSLGECFRQWFNVLRSSLIGTFIGILPGIGANIGSVVAYSSARSMSKDKAKFGKGSEEGIVASEAANNATVGGALIPLVAMGIPGSVIDAVLLGALIIHGLQPGPLLYKSDPAIVHTIIATMLLANIFMYIFMVLSVGWIAKLMYLPKRVFLPIIVVFCMVGSYALSNRMFDVWVMLAFGGIGFVMERYKIPLAPFVIGFVLAPVAEKNLGAGFQGANGSFLPLLQSPFSVVFLLTALLITIWSTVGHYREHIAGREKSE
jgi:putative tricarboxylic transport membrane protein